MTDLDKIVIAVLPAVVEKYRDWQISAKSQVEEAYSLAESMLIEMNRRKPSAPVEAPESFSEYGHYGENNPPARSQHRAASRKSQA